MYQGGYNNTTAYPMAPGYGQPPPQYVAPVPVQTQPQTVVVQERVRGSSAGDAAAAGCCGACLAMLCCCCLAAAAGSGGGRHHHRRGRW